MELPIMRNINGNIIYNSCKKIRDDGNFKVVTFQLSRKHQPLELVFSGSNSNIIDVED
jgi:hypothetical protein